MLVVFQVGDLHEQYWFAAYFVTCSHERAMRLKAIAHVQWWHLPLPGFLCCPQTQTLIHLWAIKRNVWEGKHVISLSEGECVSMCGYECVCVCVCMYVCVCVCEFSVNWHRCPISVNPIRSHSHRLKAHSFIYMSECERVSISVWVWVCLSPSSCMHACKSVWACKCAL